MKLTKTKMEDLVLQWEARFKPQITQIYTRSRKEREMKRLLVMLAGFGLVCSLAFAAELKIGYVDFEKVFNEYNKTKTEDAKLKARLEDKKNELDKKREEINKMRESLDVLGEDAKKQKEKELRDKIKELNDLRKKAEEDLLEERNKKWLEIYGEIKEVAGKFGKEKGYTFIFDDKALVYKAEGFDLTEDVIKLMNKEAK